MNAFSTTFSALERLQDALQGAMDFDYFGSSTVMRGGYPAINLFKKDDHYLLMAEVPGLSKNDFNIEVKGDLVRISGERKPDFRNDEVSLHRTERPFGRFDRTVKVPFSVDPSKVQAKYENGLLTINLTQHEADKPRRIAIQ